MAGFCLLSSESSLALTENDLYGDERGRLLRVRRHRVNQFWIFNNEVECDLQLRKKKKQINANNLLCSVEMEFRLVHWRTRRHVEYL